MSTIQCIPAFSDNYIWLLTDDQRNAAVVDPGDAAPVLAALNAAQLTLTAIMLTHHHRDHGGGVAELRAAFPTVRIYGPAERRLPEVTDSVREGDAFTPAGLMTALQVLELPGHTASHVAYLGAGRLFCGDTLFAGGCGRVFDGTFAQLAASLARIAALPPETLCYCAHEYTLANLGFAQWVEPENAALAARSAEVTAQRAAGMATVPSQLAVELATNPFLRTAEAAVIAAVTRHTGEHLNGAVAVFTALRRWKDDEYD
jgi:hydroxyacylglutathione hydrolase